MDEGDVKWVAADGNGAAWRCIFSRGESIMSSVRQTASGASPMNPTWAEVRTICQTETISLKLSRNKLLRFHTVKPIEGSIHEWTADVAPRKTWGGRRWTSERWELAKHLSINTLTYWSSNTNQKLFTQRPVTKFTKSTESRQISVSTTNQLDNTVVDCRKGGDIAHNYDMYIFLILKTKHKNNKKNNSNDRKVKFHLKKV